MERSRRKSGEENWGARRQGWEWAYPSVYPLEHFEVCFMYMYCPFKKNNHKAKRKPSQAKYRQSWCWQKRPFCPSIPICLAHLLWLAGILDPHPGSLLTLNTHHQPPLSWQPTLDRLLWLLSLALLLGTVPWMLLGSLELSLLERANSWSGQPGH